MDVVVIHPPGDRIELVTLSTTKDPFDVFFEGKSLITGYSPGLCQFGFLDGQESSGMPQNINIGFNPLFQGIYGPILFAFGRASMTMDDAMVIASEFCSKSAKIDDNRMFTERKPIEIDVTLDDLTLELSSPNLQPTDAQRAQYFVDGYEELSFAIFQVIFSGRGGFIVNFARQTGWNPHVLGFPTVNSLLQYTEYVIHQYHEALESSVEDVRSGKWSKDEAVYHVSELVALFKPVLAAYQAVKDRSSTDT